MLSRNPERARAALGVEAVAWRPEDEPAPAEALAGRDGVIHLAGEDIAQRWTDEVKRRVMRSRELGTRNLVAGLRAADPRPPALDLGVRGRLVRPRRGDEPGDRGGAAPATTSSPQVCVAWEREAAAAEELGVRVVRHAHRRSCSTRTAARWRRCSRSSGSASAARSPAGASTCRGSTSTTWSRMYLAALDGDDWTGAGQRARAPEPVTNHDVLAARSGARCTARRWRPSPASRSALLYGEMADIVVHGQRAVPGAAARARLRASPIRSWTRRCATRPRRGLNRTR